MFPTAAALWAPVPAAGLPAELREAFERNDWPRLRDLVGTASRAAYGRQVLQFRKRLPLGIDPVLSQHRGWAAVSEGDWDDLERVSAVALVDPAELAGLRDIILAPVGPEPRGGRPSEANEFVLGSWACDLDGSVSGYRRLMRRMLGWRSVAFAVERGVSAAGHARHQLLQGRFMLALLEAAGGRLDLAAALVGEAVALGDEDDVLRVLASDLEGGIAAARGGPVAWTLRYPVHLASPRGHPPLDAAAFLLRLGPLLALRRDGALGAAAALTEGIAVRFGSPRLLLQARSWALAAAPDLEGAGSRADALLVEAHRAGPGLRYLPLLLRAIATRQIASFGAAEREARRAGAMWARCRRSRGPPPSTRTRS